MEQVKKIWDNLSIAQRITIAVVALGVFGGLFAFSRWKRESDFRPLYTAVQPEDAGAIVQKIKESGADYRLSDDGKVVLVPSAKLAELRLQMAAAGLPKTGRLGFELFDKTNLGASEFVEHMNYRRALEGELERSVMSLAEVDQARVHLTFPKDSVFLEAQQPAKASIVLRLKPGAKLTRQNVAAICNLVAGSVEGLAAEAVSVVDMNGNLLTRPRKSGGEDSSPVTDDVLQLRQALERDLVAKMNNTLEPLLGPDRFRAGASVDCELTSGDQSEEIFDPAKSVMVTSERTEESTSSPSASGVPGTASNLPRAASRAGSASSGVARVTENVTYQTSKVTKHTRNPQGAIKRMSLSVLVDHTIRWEGEGARRRRVVTAASPETLKSIRELVSAVTGFSTERGDQLVVETLPFDSTVNQEPLLPPPAAQPASRLTDKLLLPVAVAAGGLLIVVVAVSFRLRKQKRRINVEAPTALPAAEEKEVTDVVALQSPVADEAVEPAPEVPQIAAPAPPRLQRLTDLIREAVAADVAGSSNVVRGWLSEDQG